MSDRVLTVIDVGNSTIKGAIASVTDDRKLEILSTATTKSIGVKNGRINDINDLSKQINEITSRLIKESEATSTEIYTNISGTSIIHINKSTEYTLSEDGSMTEINDAHLNSITDEIKKDVLNNEEFEGYEIIHTIPMAYKLDDSEDTYKHPVMFNAKKVYGEITLILAKEKELMNYRKAFKLAGCNLTGFIASPIASSYAITSKENREIGCVTIDIGSALSDSMIFINNNIKLVSSIESGSSLITNDIYSILKTPPTHAEKLKKEIGSIIEDNYNWDEPVSLASYDQSESHSVPSKLIRDIIVSRVTEILELNYKNLVKFYDFEEVSSGLYLTGNAVQSAYFKAIAKEVFNLPIITGQIQSEYFKNEQIVEDSLEFSTAYGMLIFALSNKTEKHTNRINPKINKETVNNIITKVKNFFTE